MSSSIDNTDCPECGGTALAEQDTKTCEIHVWCTEGGAPGCGYDSDDEEEDDFLEFDEIDEFDDFGG